MSSSKIHELKTVKSYFEDLLSGKKTFEIRLNDRDFKVGDKLLLVEYDHEDQHYTGRHKFFTVTYVLGSLEFIGLRDGFVALGLNLFNYVVPESGDMAASPDLDKFLSDDIDKYIAEAGPVTIKQLVAFINDNREMNLEDWCYTMYALGFDRGFFEATGIAITEGGTEK